MSEEQNKSEVARLRVHIEAEHQACVSALYGLSSGTLQHAFIDRRMHHMDRSVKRLDKLIGEEQTTGILCEVFDKTPNRLIVVEKPYPKGPNES
jgi:hypothetical protein